MLAALLGLLLTGVPLDQSVLDGLTSPLYAVRETARDELRASFRPTDHTKWDRLQATLIQLKGVAMTRVVIVAKQYFGVEVDPVRIGDDVALSHNALDRDWVLDCRFEDGALVSSRLKLEPPLIDTGSPPNGYTGLWRTYREDGSCASQTYYSKGRPLGPLNDSPIYPGPRGPTPPSDSP